MGFWVFFSDDKIEYYDSDACELYLSPDRTVAIVANSKTILDFLIVNRNAAMSRDQIIARIDGIEDNHCFNNKCADRSPIDQAIRELRKKLAKYADCVKTVRGVGYKYVGPPKVEKDSSATYPNPSCPPASDTKGEAAKQKKKPSESAPHYGQSGQKAGNVHSSNENVVKLASVLIHKGDRDHPAMEPGLELEINNIIELLEQGLSDDFEEVCEQAWQDLSLMQKALRIFKAYENLTDRVRNMSQSDTNTRL